MQNLKPGNPNGWSSANGTKQDPLEKPATLSDAGIDKHLADRARRYAAVPEGEFESILADRRERIETENKRVGEPAGGRGLPERSICFKPVLGTKEAAN